jgi:hypothetical protein
MILLDLAVSAGPEALLSTSCMPSSIHEMYLFSPFGEKSGFFPFCFAFMREMLHSL